MEGRGHFHHDNKVFKTRYTLCKIRVSSMVGVDRPSHVQVRTEYQKAWQEAAGGPPVTVRQPALLGKPKCLLLQRPPSTPALTAPEPTRGGWRKTLRILVLCKRLEMPPASQGARRVPPPGILCTRPRQQRSPLVRMSGPTIAPNLLQLKCGQE